jgi:methylphosphotriester-DNA--protein-cysteine methyltransferase
VNPYSDLTLIDDRSVFSRDVGMLPESIIDMRDVDRANKQLHQIYSLYNGHMQISLTSRDEILESKFYRNMMRELGQMRQ